MAAGLPEVHADPGQRDLRGARRHAPTASAIQDDEESFDPDLSSELYITNGDALDDAYHTASSASPPRAPTRRPERHRLRVRRRRGRGPGGVPAPPEVLARPRASPPRSPRTRSRTSATSARLLHRLVPGVVRRSAGRAGHRQALARHVKLHYRINGGRERTASTKEFKGGERYGKDTGVYYHRLRGWSRAPSPATTCRCGSRPPTATGSARFTYQARSESRGAC